MCFDNSIIKRITNKCESFNIRFLQKLYPISETFNLEKCYSRDYQFLIG